MQNSTFVVVAGWVITDNRSGAVPRGDNGYLCNEGHEAFQYLRYAAELAKGTLRVVLRAIEHYLTLAVIAKSARLQDAATPHF